ncbi:hypothetical protein SAMN05216599_11648 [Pseudomonas cichorii]|nr:hypothetical protein SAMN05216599_11648 [Pseudomonas cichorii]
MHTHTDSPFINVTSLGPRSKTMATAQTLDFNDCLPQKFKDMAHW